MSSWKESKAKLLAGGVVKPEEISIGVIQIETIASGAKLPVSTGGGVITGGDTPPTPVTMYTFTIVATPSDAVVKINGAVRSTITAKENSLITWEVSKDGYTTQSGSETLTADITKEIELVAVPTYTFAISPVPANAVVTINGTITNSVTVNIGTVIDWSVEAEGYTTQSGSLTLTEDKTLDVTLAEIVPEYTFTINPTPADAIVTINDVQRSSITAEENTGITWSVSAEGYTTQSGELILIEDKTLDVVLEAIPQPGFIQSADYTQDGVTVKLNSADLSSLQSKKFAKAWQNGFNNDFTLGDKTFSDYIYSSSYKGNTKILVIFDTPQVINKLYLSAYCGLETSVTKNISFTKPSGEGFTKSITFNNKTFPGVIDVGGEEIKYFTFNINYTSAAVYIFLEAIRINSSE